MKAEFDGKTVLVTGSTRHIGQEIARAFLKAGARVAINSEVEADVVETAEEFRAGGWGNVVEATADVACEQAVEKVFDRIGPVDILVNNACHLGLGGGILDLSAKLWRQVMDVNALGCFLCSKAAGIRMRERGGGAIVNITSTSAGRTLRNRAAYCASKGAVDALTRSLAIELISDKIRVNAVALGYVHTSRWEHLDVDTAKRRRANIPSGRAVGYEEIASTVLFLSGPSAENIVGSVVTIDGGVDAQLYPGDCEI